MRKSIVVKQVELADRRLVAPDDVLRAQLGRRLVVAHRGVLDVAQQVAQEVLVALARRPEQVRAPERQHAREVLGRVRVLAREAQPVFLQLAHDEVPDGQSGRSASSARSSGLRSKLG